VWKRGKQSPVNSVIESKSTDALSVSQKTVNNFLLLLYIIVLYFLFSLFSLYIFFTYVMIVSIGNVDSFGVIHVDIEFLPSQHKN